MRNCVDPGSSLQSAAFVAWLLLLGCNSSAGPSGSGATPLVPSVPQSGRTLEQTSELEPVGAQSKGEPDITMYAVRLSIDFASHSVVGVAKLTYVPSTHAQELRLSAHDIHIASVTSNGEPSAYRRVAKNYVIDLPKGEPAETTGQIEVAYRATPKRGLVFRPNLVYSNFFTCHWLPCKEAPGDKARFRLDISVPDTFAVVASGQLVQTLPADSGRKRYIWEESQPYSTYLYGFAAGLFTEATLASGHTRLKVFGVDATVSELKSRFYPTGDMLRFFEEKATVALPHSSYTQVLVPGTEAQEKSSFSLIGRREIDPILVDEKDDWVVSHELAHQWWGNSITCRDWSHFWLNEGITTFMVAAYKGHRWGDEEYRRELSLLRKRYQRAIDEDFDVKLSFAGTYPSLSTRRSITYSKAALFLDLLRRHVGEKGFWSGLGRFTRVRAGQSVDSYDFQRDMESATGQDLSSLFEEWVYDP